MDSFNAFLHDFGYRQKLEKYNPQIHPTQLPQKHPFFKNKKDFLQYSLHRCITLHFFALHLFTFLSCSTKNQQDDFTLLYTPQATTSNFYIAVFLGTVTGHHQHFITGRHKPIITCQVNVTAGHWSILAHCRLPHTGHYPPSSSIIHRIQLNSMCFKLELIMK